MFYQRLVPFLPKIPLPVVKQHTDAAARDFFERVPVWTADVDVTLDPDKTIYDLDLSAVGDNLLAQALIALTDEDGATVEEKYYSFINHRLIVESLNILPDEGETEDYTATVHVAGSIGCTLFPEDALERYNYAIIGRAFELLAGMTGAPWANPNVAERGRRDYRRGIQTAMIANGSSSISA